MYACMHAWGAAHISDKCTVERVISFQHWQYGEGAPPACWGHAHVIGHPKVDEVWVEVAVTVLRNHDISARNVPLHVAQIVDVLDRLCQPLQQGQSHWSRGVQIDEFACTAAPAHTSSAT